MVDETLPPHTTIRKDASVRRPQFWLVLQRCCQIAACVDLLFFIIFHVLGSPILAWVNILSIILYATAYFALLSKRSTLATVLIWSEVLGHAALGTLMVGWESGFHYYLLIFIPSLFASTRASQATLWVTILLAYYLVLDVTMWTIDPVQPIAADALAIVHLFNVVVVFALFSYLSFFYMQVVSKAHRKLSRLATTDSLTRLFNRRHMIDVADKEIERALRNHEAVSFCLLDLDHFKNINDFYGHEVGDDVLVGIAGIIQSQLRAQDSVARWGGEEFLVLLPATDSGEARQVAERIRNAIAKHDWIADETAVPVSASIGISTHTKNDDLSSVIARADRALYASKAAGRNRVEFEYA